MVEAQPGLTRNKVMLCVWWDWKGIFHYELLPLSKPIDSDLYCQQLMRLKKTIEKNRLDLVSRNGVVFPHDKSRPHSSIATQQKLRELGWNMLMHPLCSPEHVPSDFHVFQSLQNSLGSIKLTSKEHCKNYLSDFVYEKSLNFYKNGIIT